MPRVELGRKGFDFVRRRLGVCGELSRRLLSVNLEAGAVYTYLPEFVDPDALEDFDSGLPVPNPNPMVRVESGMMQEIFKYPEAEKRVETILDHLRASSSRCVLMEDSWMSHSDFRYPSRSQRSFLTSPDGGGYWVNPGAGADEVREALDLLKSFHNLVLLTDSSVIEFVPLMELSADQMDALVARADKFFISAFDHEGEIYWSRAST